MIFYFIRHAEPIYPDLLTELGKKQAEALSDRLLTHKIDKVYSSSSGRAVLTAKPFCEKAGLEPVLLEWAVEETAWQEFCVFDENGNYGKWLWDDSQSMLHFNKSKLRCNEKWYKDKKFVAVRDYSAAVNRINTHTDELLKELGFLHDRKKRIYKNIGQKYERVAFFAHGGFGMSFLSSLLDIPYPLMCLHFQPVGHTGVTAIWFDEREKEVVPRILEYSNDSHLFKKDIKPYHYLDV